MMNRKSQYWYMDFIMAITIFSLTLMVAYRFITTTMANRSDDIVLREADKISEVIMGPGVPTNWTEDNVFVIGLTSGDNVINKTKVEYLKNMTLDDYDRTRRILSIKSDFMIYFEDREGDLVNLTDSSYIGRPGYSLETVENINPKEQILLTRYVVYKHDNIAEILGLKIMLWDER